MGQISLTQTVLGNPESTEAPKVNSNFTTLQTWANGNVDGANLSAAAAQSACVNQAGQVVKGVVNIAASESRTNVAYGTLPTPDQVTGIVLPTNGLIAVWYQATWQESVSGAALATIFVGANQVKGADAAFASPIGISAGIGGTAATNALLVARSTGIVSAPWTSSYTGDVTTGQTAGFTGAANFAGPCYIDNLPAGTYTVSVQFKSSSGSVTVSNRRLRVQALSFA